MFLAGLITGIVIGVGAMLAYASYEGHRSYRKLMAKHTPAPKSGLSRLLDD